MESWQKLSDLRLGYLDEILQKSYLSDKEIDILITYAIEEPDLSLNGVFIAPCIKVVGVKEISKLLIKKYKEGDLVAKAGILKLFYWVREKTDLFCSKEKEQNMLNNNDEEYQNRIRELLPELIKCDNPILKFFFQWTFYDNQFSQYHENEPETIQELYDFLRVQNDVENIVILKKLCPQTNFDEIKN